MSILSVSNRLLVLVVFYGCISPDHFDIPEITCSDPNIVANTDIKTLYKNAQDTPQQIQDDKILEAYVVSDDRLGNFYKTISLQSHNGQNGVLIKINGYNLSTSYEVGRKVYILLKGLLYLKQNDQLVIGGAKQNRLTNISEAVYKKHLVRSCNVQNEKDLENIITIDELSDDHLNTLVKIDNVQFTTSSIHQKLYNPKKTIGRATNHIIEDVQGYNLIVRTSAYSGFGNTVISENSGSIIGVLSKYGKVYQLYLRSPNDLSLNAPRFFPEKISIEALCLKTQDEPLKDLRYVEGIVTMSGYDNQNNSKNISNRLCFLQDGTASIALYFDSHAHKILEGDRLRVYINSKNIDTYAGQLRLEMLDFDGRDDQGQQQVQILSQGNRLPIPKTTTLQELIDGKYPLQYVRVKGVQLSAEYKGLAFAGKKSITDCMSHMDIKTSKHAPFAGEIFPYGRGVIVGFCTGRNTFLIRDINWVLGMSDERCDETRLIYFEDFENTTGRTGERLSIDRGYNFSEDNMTTTWKLGSYGGNNYAQISVYKTGETVKSWLILPPIYMDNFYDEYLRFRTKDAYYNGDVLEVLISSDFDGTDVTTATWESLSAQLSGGNTSGYADNFLDSGKIDISDYDGRVYIAFKYSGSSDSVSTTVQLDDIAIYGVDH